MLTLKSINFEQQQFQSHQLKQAHPEKMEWLLGRSAACDLVLPSPEVSRIHGQIVYVDDAYHYIDVGSSSGSLLNGKSVPANEMYPLHTGDILQLGETFLHLEALTAPSYSGGADGLKIHPSVSLPDQQWAGEDLQCRCCRIVNETPDVKTFCFVAEPPVRFNYLPGQFVNLAIEIDGQPVMRSYSISSSPTRPYHLSLTIKRVLSPPDQPDLPAGLVSNWLHNYLNVGDRVKLIGGPMGHFSCLPHLPPKLLLLSAGSGITPMMSMSRWVQDTLTDCDLIFLHSARTPADLIFRTELEIITAQLPNFQLAVTLTQQPQGNAWMGLTGRISDLLLHMVVPDLLDRAVYVCGPTSFMDSIRLFLESMNFPMQNYQEESFGGKKARPTAPELTATKGWISEPETVIHQDKRHHAPLTAAQATPIVHFTQSERQVEADDSASILELAEQEGIQIRHACRVGACGACKIRVQQGQVRYEAPPMALTAADQQAGYALACVAYPNGSVAIDA